VKSRFWAIDGLGNIKKEGMASNAIIDCSLDYLLSLEPNRNIAQVVRLEA
jgi:hypothetical protein